MDIRFQSPFNLAVVGPSQSGKTIFTFKLIEYADELINPPPTKIIYCYGEYQEIFSHYSNVFFHEGLPDLNKFIGNTESILLVLDDLMSESNGEISNLFTKYGHHRHLSVVYLSQNLFDKNKHARTMSLNTHYAVLFKNSRDATQISTLARHMYPNNSKFMIGSYRVADNPNYHYLLIDLKPNTDDKIRLRTNIFPDEQPSVVFTPN